MDRNPPGTGILLPEAGRSLRGNVDRNVNIRNRVICSFGRSLRGNVDRNTNTRGAIKFLTSSRSLRGNVDRNNNSVNPKKKTKKVVPYVGTWIEIPFL